MFTVSCYAFHPLASRFIRLRRRVHVVSEWVSCVMTTVCCPCCATMPYSTSVSCYTKPSELLEPSPDPAIDPGRASGEPFRSQHIIIDFTPSIEDNSGTQDKCHQFWKFVASQPQLDSLTVQPDAEVQPLIDAISTKSVQMAPQPQPSVDDREHFPAIHIIRKMEDKGAVKAAFNITNSKKKK